MMQTADLRDAHTARMASQELPGLEDEVHGGPDAAVASKHSFGPRRGAFVKLPERAEEPQATSAGPIAGGLSILILRRMTVSPSFRSSATKPASHFQNCSA